MGTLNHLPRNVLEQKIESMNDIIKEHEAHILFCRKEIKLLEDTLYKQNCCKHECWIPSLYGTKTCGFCGLRRGNNE